MPLFPNTVSTHFAARPAYKTQAYFSVLLLVISCAACRYDFKLYFLAAHTHTRTHAHTHTYKGCRRLHKTTDDTECYWPPHRVTGQ